jgi:hypothetical protein
VAPGLVLEASDAQTGMESSTLHASTPGPRRLGSLSICSPSPWSQAKVLSRVGSMVSNGRTLVTRGVIAAEGTRRIIIITMTGISAKGGIRVRVSVEENYSRINIYHSAATRCHTSFHRQTCRNLSNRGFVLYLLPKQIPSESHLLKQH